MAFRADFDKENADIKSSELIPSQEPPESDQAESVLKEAGLLADEKTREANKSLLTSFPKYLTKNCLAVRALKDAKLASQDNYEQLLKNPEDAFMIGTTIRKLIAANMANQDNYNTLIEYRGFISTIFWTLLSLEKEGGKTINQNAFDALIKQLNQMQNGKQNDLSISEILVMGGHRRLGAGSPLHFFFHDELAQPTKLLKTLLNFLDPPASAPTPSSPSAGSRSAGS